MAAAVAVLAGCSDGGKGAVSSTSPDTTTPAQCSYSDAGDGSPLEGAAGSRLTDSLGASYDIGADCALVFVECQFTAADGQVIAGQPGTAFEDSDGAAKSFADNCATGIDPASLPLDAGLIETCESLDGTFTAPDGTVTADLRDDWWTCTDVQLADTGEAYEGVTQQLQPFCVAPAEFTSGILTTEAPWTAGWSCTPAGTSTSIEVACTALEGTLTVNNGPDDWTCTDVLIGDDTDQFADFDEFMAGYCTAPASLTSRFLTTEAPWMVGWSCTPGEALPPITGEGGVDLATTCTSVGGTLLQESEFAWSCQDIPLGDTPEAAAEVQLILAPFCPEPNQSLAGLTADAAPWLAAVSCFGPP